MKGTDWINIIVLAAYIAGMIFIALYTRNKAKTVKDFLLAGSKGLNGWMSAFSYGTTYFSAVIFIGYAGKFGFEYGLAAVWIGVGNAILGSLIAWRMLAAKTKNMTLRLDAKTMPEFIGKRYESKNLKIVSAVIIFTFLIPYSASVYNGLGNLFNIMFGIPGWAIMLILAGVTALYLFFGGYFATSLSDFVQGIIMLVGVVIMVFCFLFSAEVNFGEGIGKLIENDLGFILTNDNTSFLYGNTMSLLSLILLTSFGVWAIPQTVHKYYSVRDKKAIMQGTVVSTVFALIIGFGAYFVGGFGRLFYSDPSLVGGTDNLIPNMLVKVVPAGLMGLIAVLILSASMSTLASVSLTSASVVAVDLYKGAVKPSAEDKKVTLLMRILCLVFIIISVVIALLNTVYKITAIAYLMSLSWGVLAGCFMGPYVIGIMNKKTTKASVWVSVIGTLVLTAILIVLFGYGKSGWTGDFGTAVKNGMSVSPLIGVICMVFSVAETFIVSAFTKKPSDETIYEAFEKTTDNLIV